MFPSTLKPSVWGGFTTTNIIDLHNIFSRPAFPARYPVVTKMTMVPVLPEPAEIPESRLYRTMLLNVFQENRQNIAFFFRKLPDILQAALCYPYFITFLPYCNKKLITSQLRFVLLQIVTAPPESARGRSGQKSVTAVTDSQLCTLGVVDCRFPVRGLNSAHERD